MSDGRVPEYQYRDAVARGDRYQQRYIETQTKLDKHTMRQGVDDALRDLPDTADVDNLRTIIEGANLRVVDDRPIIDYTIDGQSMTATPREIIDLLSTRDDHANLFRVEKPKEPTPQEQRNAEIAGMPMDQYLKQRKRPGFFGPQE